MNRRPSGSKCLRFSDGKVVCHGCCQTAAKINKNRSILFDPNDVMNDEGKNAQFRKMSPTHSGNLKTANCVASRSPNGQDFSQMTLSLRDLGRLRRVSFARGRGRICATIQSQRFGKV